MPVDDNPMTPSPAPHQSKDSPALHESPNEADTSTCPPRKEGGQPGNQNARKHGLYSKFYKPEFIDDLENIPLGNMEEEIKLIRSNICDLQETLQQPLEIDQKIKIHRLIEHYTNRLDRLMRTQSVAIPTVVLKAHEFENRRNNDILRRTHHYHNERSNSDRFQQ